MRNAEAAMQANSLPGRNTQEALRDARNGSAPLGLCFNK
jgi:hypothetical protein